MKINPTFLSLYIAVVEQPTTWTKSNYVDGELYKECSFLQKHFAVIVPTRPTTQRTVVPPCETLVADCQWNRPRSYTARILKYLFLGGLFRDSKIAMVSLFVGLSL